MENALFILYTVNKTTLNSCERLLLNLVMMMMMTVVI